MTEGKRIVLVTGPTGFVGRAVVRASTDFPGLRLRLYRRSEGGSGPHEEVMGRLDDPEAMRRAMRGVSAVLHLAQKTVDEDGGGFEQVNVKGTHAVAEAARKAGVRRVVFLSTTGVYGHGAHAGTDETCPVRPDTPYAASKAVAEEILLSAHRAGHLDVSVLRPRFVYGEGDRHFIPRILSAVRKYPFLLDGGRARLSVALVDDLARVLLLEAESHQKEAVHPIFHVSGGPPVAYRDLARILCGEFGLQFPRFSVPLPPVLAMVALWEQIRRLGPEDARGTVSAVRLKLVGQDQHFSGTRLERRFPELRWTPLAQGVRACMPHYRNLLQAGASVNR